jgi:hypothetical protein
MRYFVFSFAAALLALLSPTAQTAEANWVTAPCTIAGAAELLRCAQLEVPEDWRQPSGRKLSAANDARSAPSNADVFKNTCAAVIGRS